MIYIGRQRDARKKANLGKEKKSRGASTKKEKRGPKSAEFLETSTSSTVDSDEDHQLMVTKLLEAAVTKLKNLADKMEDSGENSSPEQTDSSISTDDSSSDDGMLGLLTSVVSHAKFKRRMALKKLFGSPPVAMSSTATSPNSPNSTNGSVTPVNYEGYFAGAQDSDEDNGCARFSSPANSDDEL
jgi:hypothetical protein